MRKIFANFTGLILLAFLMAGGLSTPGGAGAQETAESKTFVVVGSAAVKGDNVSAAKEAAITDGLFTAVALMTAELLQVEAFVEHFSKLNELLFDQANTYVSGYKVLTEAAREKSYHVVVEATISRSKISKYLTEAGILRVETALPSVLFLIAEHKFQDPYPGFWWGTAGADFESISATM